jgi:hypothetical protein
MDLLWANVFLRLPICLLVARPSDLEQHRNNNIKIAQAATFAGDIPLTRPVVGQFRQISHYLAELRRRTLDDKQAGNELNCCKPGGTLAFTQPASPVWRPSGKSS